MAEDISVKVDASRINLKLEQMPEDVRRELLFTIIIDGGNLVDLARGRAEELLQVKTGKFVGRIRFGLRRSKNSISGRVFSTDPRANLFEWGGKTGAHDILPNKAKALLIGGDRFAARVHHPGGQYKRLEIIHGAFEQMKLAIESDMEAAVERAAARAND
jgi:hypothetical protein